MPASTYVVTCSATGLTTTTKTLVLLAPGAAGLRITELGISLDSASTGAGCTVELFRVTTANTTAPAGTVATPVRENRGDGGASGATALSALTTEPTTTEIVRAYFLTPYGGLLTVQFPLGREPDLPSNPSAVAAGTPRLGLRATAPSGIAPNARAYLVFEE